MRVIRGREARHRSAARPPQTSGGDHARASTSWKRSVAGPHRRLVWVIAVRDYWAAACLQWYLLWPFLRRVAAQLCGNPPHLTNDRLPRAENVFGYLQNDRRR